mgnify:CR=1 FL=1
MLAKEWHATKNGKLKPTHLTSSSHKRVWWTCPNGHKYQNSPNQRTGRKKISGCPFCAGKKVNATNSLATLRPDLVKEWHPQKNKELLPEHVTVKSNKKIWWLCVNGHEWKTNVASRSNGSNCPQCSNQTSKPEMRVLAELEHIFDRLESRKKISGVEVDIFIPVYRIAIEYDGHYYHQNLETPSYRCIIFII